jgi:hypothetical protein
MRSTPCIGRRRPAADAIAQRGDVLLNRDLALLDLLKSARQRHFVTDR